MLYFKSNGSAALNLIGTAMPQSRLELPLVIKLKDEPTPKRYKRFIFSYLFPSTPSCEVTREELSGLKAAVDEGSQILNSLDETTSSYQSQTSKLWYSSKCAQLS